MTIARQTFGSLGEDLACEALTERGYAIVTRRYRTKHGELDIIARHHEYLVFVEVKARQDDSFG
ncbi:MAG: YraN family protein, partial [Luteitalea sp.]